MSKNEKYCLYCGKKLPRIASFCVECGEKQRETEDNDFQDEDDIVVEEMPTRVLAETSADTSIKTNETPSLKQKDESHSLKPRVFAKAFLLLLAAVLVFSAAFLPMIHLGIADREDIHVSLDFSVWDYIVFLSDSYQNVSTEEGDHSPLFKDIWEIQKKLEKFEDTEPEVFEQGHPHQDFMSESLADTLRALIVLTMREQYQNVNTNLSVSFYLAGITSIIYLCFAIVFFGIAILNCFCVVIKGVSAKLDRWSVTFLCAAPMMLLISFYSMFLLHGVGYGRASLSAASTAILMFLFICIGCFTAVKIKKSYKRISKRVIGSIVCLVLSTMTIFSLFLPVVSLCAENETRQATLKMDIGCFNVFSQIEERYRYYANIDAMELREVLESDAEYLLGKSSRALKNTDGDLDEFGINTFGILAATSPLVNFRTFYSFVPAFTLLVAYLAGCVFVIVLFSLLNAGEMKIKERKIDWSCVLLLISTAIALILIGIAVMAFDFSASFSKIPSCDVIIGSGAIVNVILAIIVFFVPKVISVTDEKDKPVA